MFLRFQCKILENKGLTNQFVKMDIKKFKELIKFTLAVHSDWAKWKKGLFDMSCDYARIPALWHVAYERLYTLEGIRPPLWVRDWLETTMDLGLLTKGEAEVYRLVEAKLTELAGKDGTNRGEDEATAAAAAAQVQAVVQHMLALTSCTPGTAAIPFKIDKENEAGRKECFPDDTNPLQFMVMKHLDGKDGEAPGILMFDSAGTIHRVKKMPYSLFELQTKSGLGKAKLVEEAKLSDEMLTAPPWFLYFELEHLPAWLEALNQQYYRLALGTITNDVWVQKLREQSNSVFTGMLPLLYKTCGMSSGAQLLVDFKGLSLRFSGDCAKYAANIEQYLKLIATHWQDTLTTTLCHIFSQAPPDIDRLRDEQQRRLTQTSMDVVIKDFMH